LSAGLDRRALVAALVARRGSALLLAGLGSSAWDLAAAGDHPQHVHLWGGMGGAFAMGLGLALACPDRRVVVLTGDGEALMGLASLATIAAQKVRNLALLVLDNGVYGETGGQPTATSAGVDLAGIAAAAGFPTTRRLESSEQVQAAVDLLLEAPGPVLLQARVEHRPLPLVLPPEDAVSEKRRLRVHLEGDFGPFRG
jgi:thiamine pyrophosphate-dependent acetolactate synthase large subunit-like protein